MNSPNKKTMDLHANLLALRKYANALDIGSLVRGEDATFTSEMDEWLEQTIEAVNGNESLRIPVIMPDYMDNIHDQFRKAGLEDSEIQIYLNRFDNYAGTIVLSGLALVFDLDIGFSWAPGLVDSKCPDLDFDDDGLLVGPLGTIDFVGPSNLIPDEGRGSVDFSFDCEKVGIAYKKSYIIPFHDTIDRYNLGLSDGFLRFMSNFLAQHSNTKVRVKISNDVLLDMPRYRHSFTKAYIRGPKGVSPQKLQAESFPENPRGDVTEHRWIEGDSSESLSANILFPIEGFQVMWSRNGPLKTCQAEEIVQPNNARATEDDLIYNRYVHAIWDTTRCHFPHFDGGIRGYLHQDYTKRVNSDIKSGRELSDCYIKLWRLDGEISFKNWVDLLVRYFFGHNLATEYLEGEF